MPPKNSGTPKKTKKKPSGFLSSVTTALGIDDASEPNTPGGDTPLSPQAPPFPNPLLETLAPRASNEDPNSGGDKTNERTKSVSIREDDAATIRPSDSNLPLPESSSQNKEGTNANSEPAPAVTATELPPTVEPLTDKQVDSSTSNAAGRTSVEVPTAPVEPTSASGQATEVTDTSDPKPSAPDSSATAKVEEVVQSLGGVPTPFRQAEKTPTPPPKDPKVEVPSTSTESKDTTLATAATSTTPIPPPKDANRQSSLNPTDKADSSLITPKPASSQLPADSSEKGVKRTESTSSKSTTKSTSKPTRLLPQPPARPPNLQTQQPSYAETDAGQSTYETPPSTAANTRSSTPSTIRGLIMHDTVKRTTTIDWYITVPLDSNGVPAEFETHTSLSTGDAGNGTVTWKTDLAQPEEPVSTITIDCPARLDLRVYSTATSSSPIIDRYVDGYKEDTPKMTIPWHDLKGLVGGKNVLELLVSIAITDAKEPLPSDPVITETCSPASIEALGGFLDQPGGHDVVFQFPGRGNFLYGDRYILQRASGYFRARLQIPGERSSTPTNGMTSSSSRKKIDADSDDEFDVEDEDAKAGTDTAGPNGNSMPSSPNPKRGRTQIVPVPMQSTNGSSTPIATHSKIDFHGMMSPAFRLEPVGLPPPVAQYPPYNVGVSVTQTSEISYRTFRAVLYYMYTGYIAFAPITSNIPLTEDSDLSAKELQEKRRVARESMVKTYMRKYPNRPEPVSPKSVYVAARKYGLPSLEAHALARIQIDMSPAVTVVELFSPFTRAHQNIRDYQLEKAVNVWPFVQKTREWTNARKEAKEKPDSYFTEALFDIIDRLPQSP